MGWLCNDADAGGVNCIYSFALYIEMLSVTVKTVFMFYCVMLLPVLVLTFGVTMREGRQGKDSFHNFTKERAECYSWWIKPCVTTGAELSLRIGSLVAALQIRISFRARFNKLQK